MSRQEKLSIFNVKSLENIFHSSFINKWISGKLQVTFSKETHDSLLDVKHVEEWNAALELIPYAYAIRILGLLTAQLGITNLWGNIFPLASKLAILVNMLLVQASYCHSYHDERVSLVYPHMTLSDSILILQF